MTSCFPQQESDEGPETGSEDECDSDEEEFDEFLVSIAVCFSLSPPPPPPPTSLVHYQVLQSDRLTQSG